MLRDHIKLIHRVVRSTDVLAVRSSSLAYYRSPDCIATRVSRGPKSGEFWPRGWLRR